MNKLGKVAVALAMAFSVGAALGEEPAHYVEWVQSSGTAAEALPLPVKGKSNLKVEMKARWIGYSTGAYTVLGCYNAAPGEGLSAVALSPLMMSGKKWAWYYKTAQVNGDGSEAGTSTEYVMVSTMSNGYQYVTANGASILKAGAKSTEGDFDVNASLSLFARCKVDEKGKVTYDQPANVRVWYVKIWDEDELVYDGVPCVDANNNPGFYDKVTGTMSVNAALTAGAYWNEETQAYDLYVVTAAVDANGTVDISPKMDLYPAGTEVTVTAMPNAGYGFDRWSGALASSKFSAVQKYESLTKNVRLNGTFLIDPGEPLVRYVAPTAVGKKDGTSWANAGTLAAMIEKVGINPQGGEVHMKAGAYQMASGSVELMPNTRVIGGYAGEDEDEEPTGRSVLHGSNNDYVWNAAGTSTGIKIVDKTAGCINLPPFADYPATVKWTSSGNYCVQWSLVKSTGSLANGTLENLDLATAYSSALKLTTTEGDCFTVKNCRFVANTYGQGDSMVAVQASNSNYVFEDCEFYCNRQAFRSESSVAGGTNFLRRCLFKHNANCDYSKNLGASAVSSDGKSCFVIEDCVFEDNVADKDNYGPSASLAVNSASGIRVSVSNCMFRGNYSANKAAGNCKFNIPGEGLITFDDCSFVGNTNSATSGYCNSPCVGIDNSASIRFRNCYFARNRSDIGTGSATSIGAILAIGSSFDHNVCFVNCTIEDNYARSAVGRLVNEYRTMHHIYINCLFRNNDCFKGDGVTRSEEIVRADSWTANKLNIVNSIFMHTESDYAPVAMTANCGDFGYANSYLQGIDFATAKKAFAWDILTDIEGAPKLATEYARTPGGAPTLGIADDSPLRKLGRKVWEGSDGWYYIYDSSKKKWRSISRGAVGLGELTSAQAESVGLSLAKAPIEDAVGHARVKRPSPGPVDFPPPGMLLLVK